MRAPEMRTNLSRKLEVAGIVYETVAQFDSTAMHETRHVWQNYLNVRTGSPSRDDEALFQLPNRNPDNNDDVAFYQTNDDFLEQADCLPERAILASGRDAGLGSARGIIDDPNNLEFGESSPEALLGRTPVHGETPDAEEFADLCRAGTNDTGLIAVERDAVRFTRALDLVPR